jgi:hypothetical protein
MSEAIQRFDYAGVVGDIEYAEGTYVRYEDHLSAMDNMMKKITGNIVDKAWDLGWDEGYAMATTVAKLEVEDAWNKAVDLGETPSINSILDNIGK